jgi:hypothetical protein
VSEGVVVDEQDDFAVRMSDAVVPCCGEAGVPLTNILQMTRWMESVYHLLRTVGASVINENDLIA